MSRVKERNLRKKKQTRRTLLFLFVVSWAFFILFMSTRSYQEQTIRPLLIKTAHQLNLNVNLPNITIHYAGHSNNLQKNPYGFVEFVFRKCAHMFVYGTLTLLAYFLIRRRFGKHLLSFLLPLILIVAIASIDEYLQKFSEGRTSSPYDVLLDFTGGCIALLLMILIQWYTRRRRSKDSSSLIT